MRIGALPLVGVELGAREKNTAISVTERAYVLALPGECFPTTYRDHRAGQEILQAREKVTTEDSVPTGTLGAA